MIELSPEVWRRLCHEAGHVVAAEWHHVKWRLVGMGEVALDTHTLEDAGVPACAVIAVAGAIAEARIDADATTPKSIVKRMSLEDELLAVEAPDLTVACAEANRILEMRWDRLLDLVTAWSAAMVSGDFAPAKGHPEGYCEG